jgi:diacylglycerol kinase family enzyme
MLVAVRTTSHGDWLRAEAPQRPVLFINPLSGGGKAGRARLDEAARERGVEPVLLTPGDDLEALVGRAVADGCDALGMAGGDGSLAVVASAAVANGLPFVCVPAGTRNHFARDLGIAPNDLVGALDAFADARERSIDVGDVNGRLFLNNVSLGIYGTAVQRATYRNAKVRTLFETAAAVRGPSAALPAVRLVDDRGITHTDPAVVLVSNNPYALERPSAPGMRPALDSGLLGVLVLRKPADARHGPGRAWTTLVPADDAARIGKRRRDRLDDGQAPDVRPHALRRQQDGARRARPDARRRARAPRRARQPHLARRGRRAADRGRAPRAGARRRSLL